MNKNTGMTMTKQTMKGCRRDVSGGIVPKTIGRGRVLMHNHVKHDKHTPCGVNGFRAWTDSDRPQNFVLCECGWSGLPHYRKREPADVRRRLAPEEEIRAWQERQVRDARRWAKKHSVAEWLDEAEELLQRMDCFPVDLDAVQEVGQALERVKANPTNANLKELAEQLGSLGEEMRVSLSAEPVDAYSLADGIQKFWLAESKASSQKRMKLSA
jgi:hypothetical protein